MAKKVKALQTPVTQTLTAESLGLFVKAKRTQAGLRLEDAAMLCGVAKDTLSKIESGEGAVRLESVLLVCRKLGVSIELRSWGDDGEA